MNVRSRIGDLIHNPVISNFWRLISDSFLLILTNTIFSALSLFSPSPPPTRSLPTSPFPLPSFPSSSPGLRFNSVLLFGYRNVFSTHAPAVRARSSCSRSETASKPRTSPPERYLPTATQHVINTPAIQGPRLTGSFRQRNCSYLQCSKACTGE